MADRLRNLNDAAEALDVHPVTLKRWGVQGKAQLVRLPNGYWRMSESELARLMAAQQRSEAVLEQKADGRKQRNV